MQQNTARSWSFPHCPAPPHWQVDWEGIQRQFSWIRALGGVEQDSCYHAEGDVLIHTGMVANELARLDAWRALPEHERALVFAAALLHDVAKPQCTRIEESGRISSRGHARQGELMTRQILWSGAELVPLAPLPAREQIARMVRFHGLPLHFLERPQPERTVIAASMSARLDHVALLAEADVRGRICADQVALLEQIELFRELCKEQGCYEGPRQFPSAHSRFVYFHSEHGHPDYDAYDDTTFEVVLMAGLPGVGKDSWLARNLSGWPVIALDEIRRQMRISPEERQGRVIQAAKELARSYMRQRQSFAWNATNVTRALREPLIDFFVAYGARVRIVYLDAPLETILRRNRSRAASIPEAVIMKLAAKLDVPDLAEAHSVLWIDAVPHTP